MLCWAKLAQFHAETQALQNAMAAIAEEDLEKAREAFAGMKRSVLPPRLRAVRWFLESTVFLGSGDYEAALDRIGMAAEDNPDMPAVQYMRAMTYNALGEYEKARQNATQFLNELGDDADAYYELGEALRGLERLDEAVDAYRKGLADNKNSADCLYGLVAVDDRLSMEELGDFLRGLTDRADVFDALCILLEEEMNLTAVSRIVNAYERIAPDDPNVAYHRAYLLIDEERFAEAAATVVPAIPKVKDAEEQTYFVELYLDAMVADDKPIEGYRNAIDAVHAFEYVADHLVASETVDTLTQLLEIHRKDHADDKWIPYYVARIAGFQKDWTAVIQTCRDNIAASDEETAEALRWQWWHALYEQDKFAEAIRDVGPAEDAFHYLIVYASSDSNADRMAAIVEAYRAVQPGDPQIKLWLAEIDWTRGEYANAVQLLEELRAGLEPADPGHWRVDDRHVRSLIHLRRYDDAVRVAKRVPGEGLSRQLLILAHAARGDVGQTQQVLQEFVDDGNSLAAIYGDEMTAKALATDAMRAIRDQFPNPLGAGQADEPADEPATEETNGQMNAITP